MLVANQIWLRWRVQAHAQRNRQNPTYLKDILKYDPVFYLHSALVLLSKWYYKSEKSKNCWCMAGTGYMSERLNYLSFLGNSRLIIVGGPPSYLCRPQHFNKTPCRKEWPFLTLLIFWKLSVVNSVVLIT